MTAFGNSLAVGLIVAAIMAIYIAIQNSEAKKNGQKQQEYWAVLIGGALGFGLYFVGYEIFGKAKPKALYVKRKVTGEKLNQS